MSKEKWQALNRKELLEHARKQKIVGCNAMKKDGGKSLGLFDGVERCQLIGRELEGRGGLRRVRLLCRIEAVEMLLRDCRRKRRLQHFTERREVVIGDPSAEFKDIGK